MEIKLLKIEIDKIGRRVHTTCDVKWRGGDNSGNLRNSVSIFLKLILACIAGSHLLILGGPNIYLSPEVSPLSSR